MVFLPIYLQMALPALAYHEVSEFFSLSKRDLCVILPMKHKPQGHPISLLNNQQVFSSCGIMNSMHSKVQTEEYPEQ